MLKGICHFLKNIFVDIISLKLEIASRNVKGKLYGFPIYQAMPNIAKEAVFKWAVSASDTKTNASRILGMGDIVTLAEKAQKNFDQTKTLELEKKMRQSTFDLEDFLGQLDSLKSMGPLGDVLGMIPGMGKLSSKLDAASVNERHLSQIQAIILSMTVDERRDPNLINGSRKKRIAKGSGTSPQQVNQLLNQFSQTRKLMKQMNSGQGFKAMQRLLR